VRDFFHLIDKIDSAAHRQSPVHTPQKKVKMNSLMPYCAFVEPLEPSMLPFATTWLFIITVLGIALWWATDVINREAELEQSIKTVKTTVDSMDIIVKGSLLEVVESLNVLKETTANNPRQKAMGRALDMFLEERVKQCQDEKSCLERNRDMYRDQLKSLEDLEIEPMMIVSRDVGWAFNGRYETHTFANGGYGDYTKRKSILENFREPVRVSLRQTETALALRDERIEQFSEWRRLIATPDG
jgi:hypothetical protein